MIDILINNMELELVNISRERHNIYSKRWINPDDEDRLLVLHGKHQAYKQNIKQAKLLRNT